MKKILLPVTNTIGKEEEKAALRVLRSGVLSGFVGVAGKYFLGGPEVRRFEELFRKKFKVKHAVSFNSATTALEAAVAALELPSGSEIIVSPYTMSATVTAIIVNGLTPVFADIDKKTFCLNSRTVGLRITRRTGAILVTNLFGGSANYQQLTSLAKRHRLKIIEDNAQSPGGTYKKKYLGTIGDIGVFSFNFHKVIQCGEGGILVTNNVRYASNAQLKRNHGEVALDDLKITDHHIVGSNFRMTELHAAIAAEQLKKLDFLNRERIKLATYLSKKLTGIPGIEPPSVPANSLHVFYVYPFLFKEREFGISREQFIRALVAEGLPAVPGYQKPLYLLNLFQNPSSRRHWPNLVRQKYLPGNCPVAERLYKKELVYTTICRYPLTKRHIDLFVRAIKKIYKNRQEFK